MFYTFTFVFWYFLLYVLNAKGWGKYQGKKEKEASTGMQSKQIPASPGNAVFTQPTCAHCLYKLYLVYALVTICQPAPISEPQSRSTDSLPHERLIITSEFLVGYKNGLQKYLQPVCHTAVTWIWVASSSLWKASEQVRTYYKADRSLKESDLNSHSTGRDKSMPF